MFYHGLLDAVQGVHFGLKTDGFLVNMSCSHLEFSHTHTHTRCIIDFDLPGIEPSLICNGRHYMMYKSIINITTSKGII
jgi:hypothetical protein